MPLLANCSARRKYKSPTSFLCEALPCNKMTPGTTAVPSGDVIMAGISYSPLSSINGVDSTSAKALSDTNTKTNTLQISLFMLFYIPELMYCPVFGDNVSHYCQRNFCRRLAANVQTNRHVYFCQRLVIQLPDTL